MHVCLWLHEYVFYSVCVLHLCVHVCICVYIYVVYIFTCTSLYMYLHICVHMYTCMFLCLNICVHMYVPALACQIMMASRRWQPCCGRSRTAGDWQLDQFYCVK